MTTWSLPSAVPRHRWSPTSIFVGVNARERARVGLLIAVGVVGLAFRFWLANNSIGCQDADIWKEHADLIATRGGVGFAYEHPELEYMPFNHPPLMGYFSVLARRLSGSDVVRFSFLMKLPGLLAEVMTAGLIWSIWSKRNARAAAGAVAAYAVSPTLIMVSGFHGNTDCAYAGLTLLSFYLLCEKNAPLLSGLALAAALNVKIMPVLLIPPLLTQCRSWRQVLLFSAGTAAAIVPFLPFLVANPSAMYRNMVAYNSLQMEWGLHAFLSYANDEAMLGGMFRRFTIEFIRKGRYLIVGTIVAMSVLAAFREQRLRYQYQLGAATWAIFLVLTPGYGVQFSVSVLPLLFAANVGRAVAYSVLAGAMLFFIYGANMTFVLPLHGGVQYWPWPKPAVLFGILAWAVLVGHLVTFSKRLAAGRA
jgi:hypothetical protein